MNYEMFNDFRKNFHFLRNQELRSFITSVVNEYQYKFSTFIGLQTNRTLINYKRKNVHPIVLTLFVNCAENTQIL